MSEDDIIYRSSRSLKIGELQRYIITFEPEGDCPFLGSLWLKVRNTESVAMRAAILRGPYIAYVDVTPMEYQMDKPTFVTLDQPKFEPNLSPSQSFLCELSLHMIKKKYLWTVDVVSQILFSSTTDVAFELMIGLNKECLSKRIDKLGSFDKRLIVNRQDTIDLWNLPMPIKGKPVHLVVLTHGLHSNTGADLHYMKERLDALNTEDEQLIVRGFHGNSCKTERGVKYLGSRLGEYIIQELYNEDVKKISFVGHSLGGLVQTFAIAYIQVNFPWFFERVQPINFITMASPLLGIVTDNPAYVKAALSFGFVGRTGQDLGLESIKGEEPLLKLLPTGPTHKILRSFQKRTLYANAINDGIVPLYTAALLYLDWKGLNTVSNIKYHKAQSTNDNSHEESTGKIPSEDQDIMTSATNSFTNPFQKAINLLTPNAQAAKSPEELENRGNVFPKTSMIESAASIVLPPLPPMKLITDPASREDVIIHDRVYTEDDIPPKTVKKRSFMQNLDPLAKFEELEEDIAREWHKGMDWRKVLVKLEPDAHNNMIVRRRYANAFGWPVVEHMVINHFCGNNSSFKQCESDDSDELENLEEMNSLADRETLQRDNAEMDLGQESMLNHWVNKQSEETIFDIGAAGMMTNFNDLLDNFRNWSLTTNFEVPPTTENTATQVVEESDINPQDSYIESTYLR
jgi:hypothetical protein